MDFLESMKYLESTLTCSICTDLLRNPASSKCGHPFCETCITNIFNGPKKEQKCPLCKSPITRRNFRKRDNIRKITAGFEELVEALKKDNIEVDLTPFEPILHHTTSPRRPQKKTEPKGREQSEKSRPSAQRKRKIEVYEDPDDCRPSQFNKFHENTGIRRTEKGKTGKRDYSRKHLQEDSQFLSVSQRPEQLFEERSPPHDIERINLGGTPNVAEKIGEWFEKTDEKAASPPSIADEVELEKRKPVPQPKRFFKSDRVRSYTLDSTPITKVLIRSRTKTVPVRLPLYMQKTAESPPLPDPYELRLSQNQNTRKGKAKPSKQRKPRGKKVPQKSPSPDLRDDFDRLFAQDLKNINDAVPQKAPAESPPEIPNPESPEIQLFSSQRTDDFTEERTKFKEQIKAKKTQVKYERKSKVKQTRIEPEVSKGRTTRARNAWTEDKDLNIDILFSGEEQVVVENISVPTTSVSGVIPPEMERSVLQDSGDRSKKSINGKLVKNLGKFRPPLPVTAEKAESLVSVLKGSGIEREGAKKKVMFCQPTEIALYDLQSSVESSNPSQDKVMQAPQSPLKIILTAPEIHKEISENVSPAKSPKSPGWSRIGGLKGEFGRRTRSPTLDVSYTSKPALEQPLDVDFVSSTFDDIQIQQTTHRQVSHLPAEIIDISEEPKLTPADRITFQIDAETQDLSTISKDETTQDIFAANLQRSLSFKESGKKLKPLPFSTEKRIRVIPKTQVSSTFQESVEDAQTLVLSQATTGLTTLTCSVQTEAIPKLMKGGPLNTSGALVHVAAKEYKSVEVQVTQSLLGCEVETEKTEATVASVERLVQKNQTARVYIPFLRAAPVRTPPKVKRLQRRTAFILMGKLSTNRTLHKGTEQHECKPNGTVQPVLESEAGSSRLVDSVPEPLVHPTMLPSMPIPSTTDVLAAVQPDCDHPEATISQAQPDAIGAPSAFEEIPCSKNFREPDGLEAKGPENFTPAHLVEQPVQPLVTRMADLTENNKKEMLLEERTKTPVALQGAGQSDFHSGQERTVELGGRKVTVLRAPSRQKMTTTETFHEPSVEARDLPAVTPQPSAHSLARSSLNRLSRRPAMKLTKGSLLHKALKDGFASDDSQSLDLQSQTDSSKPSEDKRPESPVGPRTDSPTRSAAPDREGQNVSIMDKIRKGNEDIFSDEAESPEPSQLSPIPKRRSKQRLLSSSDEDLEQEPVAKPSEPKCEAIQLSFKSKKLPRKLMTKKIVDFDEPDEVTISSSEDEDETQKENSVAAISPSCKRKEEQVVPISSDLRNVQSSLKDLEVRSPSKEYSALTPSSQRRVAFSPLRNIHNVDKTPENSRPPLLPKLPSHRRVLGNTQVHQLVLPRTKGSFEQITKGSKLGEPMKECGVTNHFSNPWTSTPGKDMVGNSRQPIPFPKAAPLAQDQIAIALPVASLRRDDTRSTIRFEVTGSMKGSDRVLTDGTHLSLTPSLVPEKPALESQEFGSSSLGSIPSYVCDRNFYTDSQLVLNSQSKPALPVAEACHSGPEERMDFEEVPVEPQEVHNRKRLSEENDGLEERGKRQRIENRMETQDSFDQVVADMPGDMLGEDDDAMEEQIRKAEENLQKLKKKKEERQRQNTSVLSESEDIIGCSQEEKTGSISAASRGLALISSTKRLSDSKTTTPSRPTPKNNGGPEVVKTNSLEDFTTPCRRQFISIASSTKKQSDPAKDTVSYAPRSGSSSVQKVVSAKVDPEVKVLTCTGLSSSEKRVVKEFCDKFGFEEVSLYGKSVSHVVTKTDQHNSCKKTLKYLMGLAHRKWVVSLDWIIDSLAMNGILPEESFEPMDDGQHFMSRQARKSGTNIFSGFTFCVIDPLKIITREQLEDLLCACGAKVVESPSLMKGFHPRQALIVEPSDTQDYLEMMKEYGEKGVLSLSREWIIDCVGALQLQPVSDYLLDFTSAGSDLLRRTGWPEDIIEDLENYLATQDGDD